MTLDVFRVSDIVLSFEIDENTVFQQEVMGMDKITASFVVATPIAIQIEDYIIYDDLKYYVKAAPELQKINNSNFRYVVIFYGESYKLYDKMIMHLGRTKFSYTGTPLDFVMLIMDNLQEFDPTWAIGDVLPVADIQTLVFDEQSCRTALTQIAETFELEYYIDGKKLYLIEEIGQTQAITFRYGRDNAMYTLIRKPVDQTFSTVWYGFGGTKNLEITYRNALGRVTFDNSPIEQHVELYGRKEGSVTFPDIYPQRTAQITATVDPYQITDNTLDFDLNDQMITDGGAKIVFKTGDLSGNEFVIKSYNHGSKVIKFASVTEETGYIIPNDTVKPAIGDEYTLVGIVMPASYVTAAEAELEAKTIDWAENNSNPKVAYELEINEKFIRANALQNQIKAGDRITVQDTELGINEAIRIQSVEFPLVNPSLVKATISEETLYTVQEKLAKDIVNNNNTTNNAEAASLYARQIADEVRAYAILQQFKKTLVGERAVMSGAFVAGNPLSGAVAGVNGAGVDDDTVRIWAGSDYDNKETAPFRTQQDGKTFMTDAEIQNGCKVASFLIENGYIKSTDFYDPATPSGILISDDGLVSRNSNATIFSIASGIDIASSIFGVTEAADDTVNNLVSRVRAGLIGMRLSEYTTEVQNQLKYSRGVYGGYFTSIKNAGGKYEAVRRSRTDAADETMTTNDYHLIVSGDCTGVILPDSPDHGFTCEVKNQTGDWLTVKVSVLSSDDIVRFDNVVANDVGLRYGFNTGFRYDGNSAQWYQTTVSEP